MSESQSQAPISLRRFLSDTVVFGLPDLVDKALGFVLMIVLTRVMDVPDYGVLNMYGLSASILALMLALGMQNSFFRHYTDVKFQDRRRAMIGTTLWTVTVNSMLWLLMLAPMAGRFNRWAFEESGVWMSTLMFATAWLEMTESIAICRVQADGRRLLYLASRITAILCIRCLSFVLIVYYGMGPYGWIYGQLVGQTVNVVMLYSLGMRGGSPVFDLELAKSMIPYGATLIPVAISTWLMRSCDAYMINFMMANPKTQVGFYSVGMRISSIMDHVNLSFVLGWRRFAFRNMHLEEGPRLMARGMTLFFLISGYAAFGLSLLGDDLTHWIIPSKYEAGIVIIPILTLSCFFWGVGEFAAIGLHKSMKMGPLARLNLIAAIANVALNVPMIHWHGIVGAAASTCLCTFAKTVAICIHSQRVFYVPFEWRRLATAFAILVSAYGLGQLFDPFGWKVATPAQIVIAAVTPVVFFAMGYWKPEELELMRNGWNRARQLIRRDPRVAAEAP